MAAVASDQPEKYCRCTWIVAHSIRSSFCHGCKKMFDPNFVPRVTISCCAPVTLEELNHENLVQVKYIRWNQRYNRGYCAKQCTTHNTTNIHTYWIGRLASSPERFPYYVPSTWYRLSLQVDYAALPDWGPNWHTLYHGTFSQNIHKIIENGFKVHKCQHGFPALYLSPSINYCSHPRYARVILHNEMFYQFVLEVRVDVRRVTSIKKRETLEVGVKGDIDPNFPNNENLEYLLKASEGNFLTPLHGVVVTGVMVRRTNFDPALLPSSWWWCKWRNWMLVHHYYYDDKMERYIKDARFTDA